MLLLNICSDFSDKFGKEFGNAELLFLSYDIMSTIKDFLDQTSRNYSVKALEELSEAVTDFEQKLIDEVFSLYFTSQEIKERFAVPPDYLQFIRGVSFLSRDLGDGSPWFWVTGAEGSLGGTRYEYQHFADNKTWHELKKPPLMAIEVGGWSDKHVLFLSCDKKHHWGEVYDCHDSYVYSLGAHDLDYTSFMDLLQRGR